MMANGELEILYGVYGSFFALALPALFSRCLDIPITASFPIHESLTWLKVSLIKEDGD